MYIEVQCGSTKHYIPFKDRKRVQQLIDLLKPVHVPPCESNSRAQDAVNTIVNEAERYAKALEEEEAWRKEDGQSYNPDPGEVETVTVSGA